jgi:4-hydroxybutyrate CoA-transferase
MTKAITPADLPGLFRPGMTVFVAGCGGESQLFFQTLKANAEAAKGVRFVAIHIPGVNRNDYAGLHETARYTSSFMTPDIRASAAAGRVDFVPMHYSDVTAWLRGMRFDLALMQLAPLGPGDHHSVGIAADFVPSVLDRCDKVVAHINPSLPSPPDGPRVPASRIDYAVTADEALLHYDMGAGNAALTQLGANIASLVGDGDVVQIGLGKIQATVLDPLHDRKNLRLHAGMIADPVMALAASGALAGTPDGMGRAPIVTGVALGSPALYDFVAERSDIAFRPVTHTHAIDVLAGIDNLVAINSAIEVDLLGQANAEMIGGRQISASGGLVDFLRGARRSKNGRAIVGLVSTTSDGKTSRIVPGFAPGTAVSVARSDIDYVVTENGIADLRGKAPRARAEALIEVAAPQFRSELTAALKG